jgi:hypothetical protein
MPVSSYDHKTGKRTSILFLAFCLKTIYFSLMLEKNIKEKKQKIGREKYLKNNR